MRKARIDPGLLVASAFLSSAAVLQIEILAGRMLAPYVGMSVYSWTAIISTILAGLSIGHWLGGRWSSAEPHVAIRRLALIFAAASVSAAAILLVMRPVAGFVLARTESAMAANLLLAGLVFLPPALIGGLPAPMLTRLGIALDRANEGRVLGRLYSAGAAGAIAGSVATGFWFIPYLGSAVSVALAAAVFGGLALLWFARARWLAGALAALAVLGAVGTGGLVRWDAQCDRESAYFCLRVVAIEGGAVESAEVRGLVLDHLVHGVNVRGRPEVLFSPYLAQMHAAARALHPAPRRAFFVGGGAYTLPRLWAKGLDVTVAEIDPAVTALAAERLWVDPDAMVIEHRDARRALTEVPDGAFDLIVGDAFKDIAAPFHLVTREFDDLVARKLAPGGLYLMNLVDRGPDFDAMRAVHATLRSVFPAVAVWRETGQGEGRTTFVFAAGTRPLPPAEVAAATAEGWRPVPPGALETGDALVLTDDFAPLERLLRLAEDSLR